jgi:hypothetical protein
VYIRAGLPGSRSNLPGIDEPNLAVLKIGGIARGEGGAMTSGNRGDHGIELRDGTSGCLAASRYSCIVPSALLVEGKNAPLKILLKEYLASIFQTKHWCPE